MKMTSDIFMNFCCVVVYLLPIGMFQNIETPVEFFQSCQTNYPSTTLIFNGNLLIASFLLFAYYCCLPLQENNCLLCLHVLNVYKLGNRLCTTTFEIYYFCAALQIQ